MVHDTEQDYGGAYDDYFDDDEDEPPEPTRAPPPPQPHDREASGSYSAPPVPPAIDPTLVALLQQMIIER